MTRQRRANARIDPDEQHADTGAEPISQRGRTVGIIRAMRVFIVAVFCSAASSRLSRSEDALSHRKAGPGP